MDGTWRLLLVGAPLLVVAQMVAAQESAPAPAEAAPAQTVAAPQQTVAAPQPTQTAEPQIAAPTNVAPEAKPAKPAKPAKQEKPKKVEYTGPNTVIVMPPTPMIDEEGKQRLDPDGQPMFNPAVRQQRDKKGHPLFDDKGKPVFQTASDLGYDEHGKKIKVHKEKEPKKIPVSISRGTFTVDGMIGKAELNYTIADLKFIYLYAPGIGTLVVSDRPFAGSKEEKNAFNQKTLTVTTGDHTLQVASDSLLLGKKPVSAFVLVDRDFYLPSPYPVMGYGTVLKAPYVWPGGRPNEDLKGAFVKPPPIPINLQPVLLLPPCPEGQMRKPAPPALPGQKTGPQPCVLIPKGTATVSGPAAKKPVAAVPAATPAPAPPLPPQ
jgi:hypothetical protein